MHWESSEENVTNEFVSSYLAGTYQFCVFPPVIIPCVSSAYIRCIHSIVIIQSQPGRINILFKLECPCIGKVQKRTSLMSLSLLIWQGRIISVYFPPVIIPCVSSAYIRYIHSIVIIQSQPGRINILFKLECPCIGKVQKRTSLMSLSLLIWQ